MKNIQKRNRINNMNPAAQSVKLGNVFPFAISKVATSVDVSKGEIEIETELNFNTVCSVCAIAKDGSLKEVTSVAKKDGTFTVAVVEVDTIAVDDTVTIMVL